MQCQMVLEADLVVLVSRLALACDCLFSRALQRSGSVLAYICGLFIV